MLERKTILVTGAASGVEHACAVLFAKLGAHLVLTDVESEKQDESRRLMGHSRG